MLDQEKLAQEASIRAWEADRDGDYERALEEINTALSLRPDIAHYVISKSMFLRQLGDLDSAAVAGERGVELAPRLAGAWVALGLVRIEQERFEEGGDCYERAAQIKPDPITFAVLAGLALEYDPEKAAWAARKSLELDPDSVSVAGFLESAEILIARDTDSV